MSPDYLRAAAEALRAHGFVGTVESCVYGPESDPASPIGTRHVLERGPRERFVLECVASSARAPLYFLELVRYHGIRANSFGLESWKVHRDRIEFKLVGDGDASLGFAFVLEFEDADTP